MIIIETCPICGCDLIDVAITTFPPIQGKVCLSCGWSCDGSRDEIIRVPFKDDQDNKKYYITPDEVSNIFEKVLNVDKTNEDTL